jgi:hypothetical protein
LGLSEFSGSGLDRIFYNQNSLINFGPTKTSPLDLKSLSDLEIDISLKILRPSSYARIFDNGQLSFGLLDNHFFLFLKTFYGHAGFISNLDINLDCLYDLKITFDSGFLCLFDQSNRLGCTYTGLNFIDAEAGGSSILVGEGFVGSVSSMKFSSYSRFDITAPLVSIVSPNLDGLNPSLNELKVYLSDNLSGIDPSSIKVFFNGDELLDIQKTSEYIQGTLPIDTMLEVNELVIVVSDLSGNEKEVELLIEPLKVNQHFNESLDVEAKQLSLSKKQTCLLTNFNDVRCLNTEKQKLSIVTIGEKQVLRDVSIIQTGESFSCAQDILGDIFCWSGNNQFQSERLMGLPAKSVQMSLGKDYGCALLENFEVWCFGKNLNPLLLHNYPNSIDLNLAKFSNSVCSVFSNGFIRCFDLFDGASKESLSFQYTSPKKSVETFSAQCILDDDYKANCFSRTTGHKYEVFEGISIAEIKGAYDTLCALDIDNDLYCLNEQKNKFSKINFSSKVLYFDVGKDYSCAILVSGETQCFGSRTKLPHVI